MKKRKIYEVEGYAGVWEDVILHEADDVQWIIDDWMTELQAGKSDPKECSDSIKSWTKTKYELMSLPENEEGYKKMRAYCFERCFSFEIFNREGVKDTPAACSTQFCRKTRTALLTRQKILSKKFFL